MMADAPNSSASNPQCSVITPSFQSSAWLRLCVESVADQAGVTFEHIVQDGGSTDGTGEWIGRDKRLRAFIEKDAGMYDAINRGLSRARGSICSYLNCDEQLLPGTLAKVDRFFAAHPDTDVLFGDAVLVDARGMPLSYRRIVLPSASHVRLVHLNTLSCSMFFRRRLIERGLLFDPTRRAIGDAVWISHLLAEQVRMATLHEPLAVFSFTGENLGASTASKREADEWRGKSSVSLALRSLFAKLQHRLRKGAAGAYFRRPISIAIYTFESPTVRLVRHNPAVGYSWPEAGRQIVLT
jgi:glycosyltransferase involved in cell wall biosynthesis